MAILQGIRFKMVILLTSRGKSRVPQEVANRGLLVIVPVVLREAFCLITLLPCQPTPTKFRGWQIHPLNLGGGVSEAPCFTVCVFLRATSIILGGERSPLKLKGMGLQASP